LKAGAVAEADALRGDLLRAGWTLPLTSRPLE